MMPQAPPVASGHVPAAARVAAPPQPSPLGAEHEHERERAGSAELSDWEIDTLLDEVVAAPDPPRVRSSGNPTNESRGLEPPVSGAIAIALAPGRAPAALAGMQSAELARRMVPLRPNDPLGLGLAARPAPPPDPDAYDRALEDKEYARSLLSPAQRAGVDKEVEVNGFLTIAEVRRLVLDQSAKSSTELSGLDPELMAVIDARINYKVFVAGDNIYTREELYENYPFHEFQVQPEAIFAQQELGVFPPKCHALTGELEYLARDAGDESVEFVMLEDMVGLAARPGYRARRAPLRVAKTKIYVGKEQWEDFAQLQRLFRGAARVARAQLSYSGQGGGPMLALLGSLTGAAAGAAPGAPALALARGGGEDSEAAAARREEDLRRREEEVRRWEASQRAERELAEANRQRVEADIRRLEAMLIASSSAARSTPAPVPDGPALADLARSRGGSPPEDSDSVEI